MPNTFPTITESTAEIAELLRRETREKYRKPLQALQLVKSRAISTRLALAYHLGVTRGTVDRWMRRYAASGVRAFAGGWQDRAPIARTGDPDRPCDTFVQTAQTPPTAPDANHIGLIDHEERTNGTTPLAGSPPAVREAHHNGTAVHRERTNGAPPLASPPRTPHRRVLLGEADNLVAGIVEGLLKREGIGVDRASDGLEFVSLAEEHPVDLFLIDIRLAGLDGFQITRWLRESEHLNRIPVILLGWPGKETDVVDAFDAGADDYILKPFSPVDLSARIGRLLRQFAHSSDAENEQAETYSSRTDGKEGFCALKQAGGNV